MPNSRRHQSGWWPAGDYPDAVVDDELHRDGQIVACVMQFYDDAPAYGIASLPEGPTVRSGAVDDAVAAKDWCERLAGLKPRLPRDLRYLPKESTRE